MNKKNSISDKLHRINKKFVIFAIKGLSVTYRSKIQRYKMSMTLNINKKNYFGTLQFHCYLLLALVIEYNGNLNLNLYMYGADRNSHSLRSIYLSCRSSLGKYCGIK